MPEPTTRCDAAVQAQVDRVRDLLAKAEQRTGPNGDFLIYNEDCRNLLTAYDAALAEVATHEEVLEQANRSITKLEARAQRAEAALAETRQALADAAVQRLTGQDDGPPRLGDQVVYIDGRPDTVWENRTGIVVGMPDPTIPDSHYAVYTPGAGECANPWWPDPAKLRVVARANYSTAEPHLPADPTHHYPVRDLSGEPLPAGLEWAAGDDDYWARRMRDLGLDPETLPMPAPTEDGAR